MGADIFGVTGARLTIGLVLALTCSAAPVSAAEPGWPSTTIAQAPAQGVATSALPDGASVELYDEAFRLLRSGEVAAAGEAFAVLVSLFPDDPLATNAHYWLGETYAIQRRYGEATRQFAMAYERSERAGGIRAGDALLRLGSAYRSAGEPGEACRALDRLEREQPVEAWRLAAMVAAERRGAGCPAPSAQVALARKVEPRTAAAPASSADSTPRAERVLASRAAVDTRRLNGILQNLSYPHGQYLLGQLYEEGSGVERSLEKARDHYRRAAFNGSEPAQQALARLVTSSAAAGSTAPREQPLASGASDSSGVPARYGNGR
jgi:TPR repeat protein